MSTPVSPAKTRSPNYPAISLEEAMNRLRSIYEKQRRYPATREVLVKLMGYSSLNGASAPVISALGKYGLLEGHGEQLRVSEMGQDLALHRKGDQEYAAAVRTAAFMPTFFRELRDQFPDGLPSEHSLRATLMKRGFTSKAIDGAIRVYRDTLDFVSSETGGDVLESKGDLTPREGMQASPFDRASNPAHSPPLPVDLRQRVVALPLSVSEWATLQAPFPLSEHAWDQMIAVLMAMKPALVTPTDQASGGISESFSFETQRESEEEPGDA